MDTLARVDLHALMVHLFLGILGVLLGTAFALAMLALLVVIRAWRA